MLINKKASLGAALLLAGLAEGAFAHGLVVDPPARNAHCGLNEKPDQARTQACVEAAEFDFSGGYQFMSVLTHDIGRAGGRSSHVCGFDSETWGGGKTPWDLALDWPTTPMQSGRTDFIWNISWGPHYDDTEEFRYYITKAGFDFRPGQALSWDDFEEEAFCELKYDDRNPMANPDVVADKGASLFHTYCDVPERDGRHVIYAEWGRNHYTYERFHGCIDVQFAGGNSAPTPNPAPDPQPDDPQPNPGPQPGDNQQPSANDLNFMMDMGSSLAVELVGQDADGAVVSWNIVAEPINGVITGGGKQWQYTPHQGYYGTDQILYTVTDDDGKTSSVATVFIHIHSADHSTDPEPPQNASVSCRIADVNDWGSGFVMNVEVENSSDKIVNGWEVLLSFNGEPNVTNSWNAQLQRSSQGLVAGNVQWNEVLQPGGKVTFGFQGSGSAGQPACAGLTQGGHAPDQPEPTPDPVTPDPVTPDPGNPGNPDPVDPDPVVPDPVVPDPDPTDPDTTPDRPDMDRVDNPFLSARWYVNPDWSNKAAAEPGGSAIAGVSTAVWMDRIGAIEGPADGMGLRDHLDTALEQGANLFTVVVYNLPNRDCSAGASNGELLISENGFSRYQSEFIDPIAQILGDPAYADIRIVAVIEVDSLPNLVTNLHIPGCQQANGPGGYVDGVRYALTELGKLDNVYSYVDIAHSGWLGWSDNFSKSVSLIAEAVSNLGTGINDIAGFVSNTANYTPTIEPHLTNPNLQVGGQPVRSADFYEWNNYVDELSFVTDWRNAMIQQGLPSNIGMLIDTARNGWGGPDRPASVSSSTDLDAYVTESRVDRRAHRGNWCNQPSGIGFRPQAAPQPGVDAYVWVKPPGESDGAASGSVAQDPNDPNKKHDSMCSPNADSRYANDPTIGTGAMGNAPHAGRWFPEGFKVLLENAYPPL